MTMMSSVLEKLNAALGAKTERPTIGPLAVSFDGLIISGPNAYGWAVATARARQLRRAANKLETALRVLESERRGPEEVRSKFDELRGIARQHLSDCVKKCAAGVQETGALHFDDITPWGIGFAMLDDLTYKALVDDALKALPTSRPKAERDRERGDLTERLDDARRELAEIEGRRAGWFESPSHASKAASELHENICTQWAETAKVFREPVTPRGFSIRECPDAALRKNLLRAWKALGLKTGTNSWGSSWPKNWDYSGTQARPIATSDPSPEPSKTSDELVREQVDVILAELDSEPTIDAPEFEPVAQAGAVLDEPIAGIAMMTPEQAGGELR